jgi:hypothetical protein
MSKSDPTGAARAKLYRRRRRAGLRCLKLEIWQEEIDALVRQGLLDQAGRDDPAATLAASKRAGPHIGH